MKRLIGQGKPLLTDIPEVSDVPLSDISVDRLLDDGLLALSREMRNMTMASAKGKLDKDTARDLRDTVKLLFELKEREQDLLKGLTDEQLEKLATAIVQTNVKK